MKRHSSRHLSSLILGGLLVWCQFLRSHCELIRPIPDLPTTMFSRPGDLILGIIVTNHWPEPDLLCGHRIMQMDSLQRMESIVYAVEEINNRSDILTNVTLGFVMLDDCSSELTALSRALHFIQITDDISEPSVESWSESLPAIQAVAVIGTESSPRTMQMADLFSVFKVPLLSYKASSAALDDKIKYSYFSRIIPSDNLQAMAVADILKVFGWSYVSLVYSKGGYGASGYRSFQKQLMKARYCLAVIERVDSFSDYQAVLEKLYTAKARVVVLYLAIEHAVKFFSAALSTNVSENFTWIGTDDMASSIGNFDNLGEVLHGSLMVRFISNPVPRFEKRFRHMTLRTGSRNPWFGEFVAEAFGCSLDMTDNNACDPDKEIGTAESYEPESSVSMSMDSVYAWALALDHVLKNCTEDEVRKCVGPEKLRDTLRRVHFQGEGHSISFDEMGNGQMGYQICNLVYTNQTEVLQYKVGEWDLSSNNFSFFNKDKIIFKTLSSKTTASIPESVCSKPCAPGHQNVITQPHCCFNCDRCKVNERTVIERFGYVKCQRCPTEDNFTWPDEETRTMCLPLKPDYLLDSDDMEGILVLSIDAFAFLTTILVTTLYHKNADKRLIKASSIELSNIMLIGHMLTCAVIVTVTLRPTDARCIIITASFPLSFTLTYGPLLMKTNRIYRIFLRRTMTPTKPRFISPRAQVLFVGGIVLGQVVLTSILAAINSPRATAVMPSLTKPEVYLACIKTRSVIGFTWIYNMILMVLCAVHAFKTRQLQQNFNEARFITFAVYTTSVLWLGYLPILVTVEEYGIRALSTAIAMLFNVMSFQVFLFFPKLYAIFFLADEEVNAQVDTRAATPSLASSATMLGTVKPLHLRETRTSKRWMCAVS